MDMRGLSGDAPATDLEDALEDSPESFVSRWRRHAATAELFARPEGVPLIECRIGRAVVQLMERTGPYLSRPGPNRVIVNPTADTCDLAPPGTEPVLESAGLGRLIAVGEVLEVDGRLFALGATAPLVVALPSGAPPWLVPGATVRVTAGPPVHGFVLGPERSQARREAVDESL